MFREIASLIPETAIFLEKNGSEKALRQQLGLVGIFTDSINSIFPI